MAKTFDGKSMARVVRATKTVERGKPAPAGSGRTPPQYNVILARITGDNGEDGVDKRFGWQQVRLADGGNSYEDFGISGATDKNWAVTIDGGPGPATDDVVSLQRTPLNNGDGTYSAKWVIMQPTFPVGNRVGQGYFNVTDQTAAMTLAFFTNPG